MWLVFLVIHLSQGFHTWVNSHLVYQNGKFDESQKGQH